MVVTDVLVIGAGPFGLSISAQLRQRGVEHMIVGRPMDTWRAHMPQGMFLKSEPYGSTFSSAVSGYEIATYAKLHGLDDYVDRIGPLSIKRFVGYADWFTSQLVPDVLDLTVKSVAATIRYCSCLVSSPSWYACSDRSSNTSPGSTERIRRVEPKDGHCSETFPIREAAIRATAENRRCHRSAI